MLAAPLSRRELGARIRAVLAGAGRAKPGTLRPGSYRVGDLIVDTQAHVAAKGGRHLSLTPTEFRLLVALARRSGHVVSYGDLLAEVWDSATDGGTEKLRLYIGYLRRKLQDDPTRPRMLHNHKGAGYRLSAQPAIANTEGTSNGHVQAQQ